MILVQTQPSDPVGTNSFNGVMMGLGILFTPKGSGEVVAFVDGSVSSDTDGGGVELAIFAGLGAAPANGAPTQGWQVSAHPALTMATGGQLIPFAVSAAGAKLQVGSTYWLDLVVAASGGIGSVSKLGVTILEV